MKKSLIPLAVVAVVLVALVIIQQTGRQNTSIVDQAQLTRLTPENLDVTDIQRLELYTGAEPESKVVLARNEDNPANWVVASHYGAPVSEDKITTFIEEIDTLRGERRTTAEDDEELKIYELTEDEAFHVAAYGKEGDAPLFHVLVGKSPDFKSVFMRPQEANEVYVEDTNLRRTAGIFGEEKKAPDAAPWLDKQVLEIAEENVTKIELTMPNKSLTLEKVTPEPAEPAADDEDGAAPPPPAPEPHWTLAAGGPANATLQDNAVTSLTGKLASLTASDVVDPANKAEYGLEPPMFKAFIHLEDSDEPVVIAAGRTDHSGSGYITLPGKNKDLVYEVARYNFDALFPKGGDLLQLASPEIPGEITEITIQQPEGNVTLAKSDEGAWSVVEPQVELPIQVTAATGVASALNTWQPADYADSLEGAGLDAPERSVTFQAGEQTYTLQVGNASDTIDGYYARLSDTDTAYAISRADYDRIFKAPKEFYQLALIDARDDQVTSVTVTRGEETIAFTLDGAEWKASINGEPADGSVDQNAFDDFVVALTGLQASDIVFGETELPGDPHAIIKIGTQDAQQYVLRLGEAANGDVPLTVDTMPQLFHISAEDTQAILLDATDLLVAAEAEQPAAEQPETEQPAAEQPETEQPAAESAPTGDADAEEPTMELGDTEVEVEHPEGSAPAGADAESPTDDQ